MIAYLKLLLLNRFAALRPGNLRKEGRKPWVSMLGYAGLALLAVLVYGSVVALEMVAYSFAARFGAAQAIIVLCCLGCTFITLFYSFFHVTSVLFFSKDNTLVAALPIRSQSVLTAKVLGVIVGEAGLTALICLPLIIRHGIELAAPVDYYVRTLVCVLCLPLAPVALSTVLSTLLIRISGLWKRREGVTTVMAFLLVFAVFGLEMALMGDQAEAQMETLILDMLLGKSNLTKFLLTFYPPLRWASDAFELASGAWGSAALFVVYSVGAFALAVLLCGGAYLRLALRQEETMRRMNSAAGRKRSADKVRTPFMAIFRQEMREVIIVPTYATNCLVGIVMFPAMFVFMMLGIGEGAGISDAASLLGEVLTPQLYLAIATGLLSLTATMGMAVSTAVTREGKRHDHRRIYPVSGHVQLGAKLLMGVVYNALAILTTSAALCVLLPAFAVQTVIACVLSQSFSVLTAILSLLLDVYRPKLKWKTEAEAVKQSVNSLLAMLMNFLLLALFAGLVVVLALPAGLPLELALAIVVAVMMLANVLLWFVLKNKASITYCLREYSK